MKGKGNDVGRAAAPGGAMKTFIAETVK